MPIPRTEPAEHGDRPRETSTVQEIDDDAALDAGGWDRRFARVLAKTSVGPWAVAIIDANGASGDRTYENMETYAWDEESGWRWVSSGGGYGTGETDGLACASGQADLDEDVVVEFRGERHPVVVEPSGYWIFAAPNDVLDEVPRRIE
jgi:hypothetical protein